LIFSIKKPGGGVALPGPLSQNFHARLRGAPPRQKNNPRVIKTLRTAGKYSGITRDTKGRYARYAIYFCIGIV
ncbi:hypothetical protein, partial [Enterobacter hormaechei]